MSSRLWQWLAAAAFVVLAAQIFCGWGFTRRAWLEPRKMEVYEDEQFALRPGMVRVALPQNIRATPIALSRARILEDGRELGLHFSSRKRLMDFSGPGYAVDAKAVVLRTGDGTSPLENGRRYELQVPRTPPWPWLLLPAMALFWLRRPIPAASLEPGKWGSPAWRWAPLGLFVVVFVWRLALVVAQPQFNDQLFSIQGVPSSDAAAWLELGQSLAEGHGYTGGFDTQRPIYPFLIGSSFLFSGGAGLLQAKLVNLLAHAATVALLFCLGRRSGHTLLGTLAAAMVALAGSHGDQTHLLLTECSGLALSLLGLGLLWPGAGPAAPFSLPTALRVAAAGLFVALGILSCPTALPAAPFLAVWAALRWAPAGARPWWRRLEWKAGASLAAGMAAVLLPWMLRQKHVAGAFTISLQTADLLYTAASDTGKFDTSYGKELAAAGISTADGFTAERYKYGMMRFKEAVAADPARYVGRLWDAAQRFLEFPDARGPQRLGLLLLALGAAGIILRLRGGTDRSWAACLGLIPVAAWAIPQLSLAWTLPVAIALAWARFPAQRWTLGLLAAWFVGCMATNMVTGSQFQSRFWAFTDWTAWWFLAAGLLAALDWLGGAPRSNPATEPSAPFALGRCWLGGGLALGCLLAIAGLWIRWKPATASPPYGPSQREAALAWAGLDASVATQPIQLGLSLAELAANYEPTDFTRLFVRRPYPRVAGYARGSRESNGRAAGLPVEFPQTPLPADSPWQWWILAAEVDEVAETKRDQDKRIFRARALIPMRPDGSLDTAAGLKFPSPSQLP